METETLSVSRTCGRSNFSINLVFVLQPLGELKSDPLSCQSRLDRIRWCCHHRCCRAFSRGGHSFGPEVNEGSAGSAPAECGEWPLRGLTPEPFTGGDRLSLNDHAYKITAGPGCRKKVRLRSNPQGATPCLHSSGLDSALLGEVRWSRIGSVPTFTCEGEFGFMPCMDEFGFMFDFALSCHRWCSGALSSKVSDFLPSDVDSHDILFAVVTNFGTP